MGELFISLLTVTGAWSVHYLLWKVHLPRRQTRAILVIFFSLLAGVLLVLPWIAATLPGWFPIPLPLTSYLQIAIFVTAVTLAYMMTYTAIEVDSPSLVMILAIAQAGADGLAASDFSRMMSDQQLVEPRLRDMLRDRLIIGHGNSYRLTAKGRRMARIFAVHRRLLGAGLGG